MKVRVLIGILSRLHPDIEISVPCGYDGEGQILYTDKIKAEDMVTSEAEGVDRDGTLRETEVPMIMLLPEDGPWAKAFGEIDEEDDHPFPPK